jgi:hypothetical protein
MAVVQFLDSPNPTGNPGVGMEHEVSLEGPSRPSNANHTFPFELLGEIFSHISEDPLDLRYAILVCRSWHNAIVHCAKLWTNIILEYGFLTRFQGDRLPHGVAFVRSCLSRSARLPLRISIFGPSIYSLFSLRTRAGIGREASDECYSLFKDIVINSGEPGTLFQRCKSLTWFCSNRCEEVRFVAQAFASASAPALEYLTIKFQHIDRERYLHHLPLFPRLKEVTLIDYSDSFGPLCFLDDAFAIAERVTITTSAWYDCVNFIRGFRGIRALVLDSTYGWLVEPPSDSVNPVELPLLETLTLSGLIAYPVLSLIRAPALRKMEIKANRIRGQHSLGATNLVHLVRKLECLCLSLKEGERATFWVKELERLVAVAPVLVSVCVSPWMMQDIKGEEWITGLLRVTDSI